MRILLVILLGCFLILHSEGQSVVSIHFSKNTVQAGEVVSVFVRIEMPVVEVDAWILKDSMFAGVNTLYETDSVNFEPLADIAVLDFGVFAGRGNDRRIALVEVAQFEDSESRIIEDSLKIVFYNQGEFLLFGPVLGGLKQSSASGKPAEITVILPEALAARDSFSLQPVKDIMYEPASWMDYLPWVGGALFLLILGAIVAYINRKRKAAITEADIQDIAGIPPHEHALRAIEELRDTKYWIIEGDREFQSAFTSVLRNYSGARFKMPANRMTSTEILHTLKIKGLSDAHLLALEEMLHLADLVKFARASTPEDLYLVFLEKAIAFIKETQPINGK